MLVKPDSGEPYSIPAKKEITIRDLLSDTSGITYNWNGDLGGMYESAGVASGLLSVKNWRAIRCYSIPGTVGNIAWASYWGAWWMRNRIRWAV